MSCILSEIGEIGGGGGAPVLSCIMSDAAARAESSEKLEYIAHL